jgi:mannose-6-phosphate isomerase
MKVLAAEQPLSLQAHPTAEQAAAGFADEQRRGVPLEAPTRNYKDPHHKPELICALTPFDALCGFRHAADTVDLFEALTVPGLDVLIDPLRADPSASGLARVTRTLLTMDAANAATLVEQAIAACAAHRGRWQREAAWAVRLAAQYRGDRGVLVALLLNLVTLEPGQAIYLDAGNLHAYLSGVGVEIMASSDNVLRGGLTPKHVDVPELLRVLDFSNGPVAVRQPRAVAPDEDTWDTPAAEFRLSRMTVREVPQTRVVSGPELLFCQQGDVRLETADGTPDVVFRSGEAVFVPASSSSYSVRGDATVFRAMPGRVD